jgi:GTP pyrophosphokinase
MLALPTPDYPGVTMPDWSLLLQATDLAIRLHGGQHRRGTKTPYLSHVLAVGSLVLEHGGDAEQAAAGLLNDTIELHGTTHEAEITARLGHRVYAIIRDTSDAYKTSRTSWKSRKEAFLRHLATVGPEALLVSACDKLHSARVIVADLRTIGPQVMERFPGRAEGTLWYYGALTELYHERLPNLRLVAEFALEFDRMNRLTRSKGGKTEGAS